MARSIIQAFGKPWEDVENSGPVVEKDQNLTYFGSSKHQPISLLNFETWPRGFIH